MCGIVAVDIKDISSDQIESVKNILLETEIRGKHASGITWYSEVTKLNTIKKPVPVSELLNEFDLYRCVDDNNGHLAMIAHIRYSTSDLEFNQPITTDDNLSIVHNGIITQSDPATWSDLYGLGKPTGKNDSELVLMALKNGEHPLIEFEDSSMAVATINKRGTVTAFRNGRRPLWITSLYNGYIATSTEDIVYRSGIEYSTMPDKAVPGVEYNLTHNSVDVIVEDMEDIQ